MVGVVGAGDLANHIAARLMVAIKLRRDVETHGDRNAVRNQAMHAAKRLTRDRRRRNRLLVFGAIHEPSERSARVIVKVSAEAAGPQDGDGMLVGEKVPDLFQESHLFKYLFPERRIVRKNETVPLVAVEWIGTEMVELGLVVMFERVRWVGINLRRVAVKNDFSRQLPLPRVEVFLFFKRGNGKDLCRNFAGRRGRLPLFLRRLGEEEIVECLHPETAASQWQVPYRTTFEDRYGYNNGPRSPSGCSGEKR